jgi:hypothetical protein
MTRMDQDYALVLSGVDRLVGEMAKNLLAEAGIPALLHGPDFDVIELGAYAHSRLRGLEVYVPRTAEALAKEVLEDAFGGEVPSGASDADSGEPDAGEEGRS